MPSDLDERPTTELIRELRDHNQSYWGSQRRLDEEVKDLCLDEHKVFVPKGEMLEPERMTSGEGARITQIQSSFYVQPATIKLIWTGEGTRSPAKGEELEVALAEARDQLDGKYGATQSPRWNQVTQMVIFDRAAYLICPGDAYWWDMPKKEPAENEVDYGKRLLRWRRGAPIPVLWRDLPAESTFPPTLGQLNEQALSVVETTWWELRAVFGDKKVPMPGDNKRWNEKVELGIYSNQRWLAYVILGSGDAAQSGLASGDHLIRDYEHRLGRCAIRIASGRTTPWREPGRYWYSSLAWVRDRIKTADKRLSEAATASNQAVIKKIKAWMNRSPEEDDAAFLKRIMPATDLLVLDPGDASAGRGREDVQEMYESPTGQDQIALAQVALTRAERISGVTEAIEGQFGPGSQTAWARRFSAELAKGSHAKLTDGVVGMDIDIMEGIMRSIEAFGEPVHLQRHEDGKGIVIQPNELAGYEPLLRAEYQLNVPVNELAMISEGISIMVNARQADLPLSDFWVMEKFLGIEQPEQMWRDRLVERFIMGPRLHDWVEKHMLDEADVLVNEDEGMSMEEFERLAAEGQLPQSVVQTVRGRMAGGGDGARAAQGERRAGAPFISGPSGPQPQEVIP